MVFHMLSVMEETVSEAERYRAKGRAPRNEKRRQSGTSNIRAIEREFRAQRVMLHIWL